MNAVGRLVEVFIAAAGLGGQEPALPLLRGVQLHLGVDKGIEVGIVLLCHQLRHVPNLAGFPQLLVDFPGIGRNAPKECSCVVK